MLDATQRSCSAGPSPRPLLLPEAGAPGAAEARSDESAVHPLASTLPNPEYWPRSRAAWTSFFFAIVTSCGASGGAGALGSQHQASSWSRGQHQVMGVLRGDSGACQPAHREGGAGSCICTLQRWSPVFHTCSCRQGRGGVQQSTCSRILGIATAVQLEPASHKPAHKLQGFQLAGHPKQTAFTPNANYIDQRWVNVNCQLTGLETHLRPLLQALQHEGQAGSR